MASRRVGVVEDVVEAETADDLRGRIAGEPLRRGIPVEDSTFRIHEVDAVVKLVEHLLEEVGEHGGVATGRGGPSMRLPISAEYRVVESFAHLVHLRPADPESLQT